MHPTQHSTHHRRSSAPAHYHTGTISATADDVLEHIARIAARQATGFVLIAHIRVELGLTLDDLPWLQQTLKQLDAQDQIRLGTYEKPQDLAAYIAPWCVQNASGIPCHEVALNPEAPPRHRIAPLLRRTAPALPIYPRAREVGTSNPVLRNRLMSQLVEESAKTLFGKGSRPQTLLRVLHVEQTVEQSSRLRSSTATREAA